MIKVKSPGRKAGLVPLFAWRTGFLDGFPEAGALILGFQKTGRGGFFFPLRENGRRKQDVSKDTEGGY